MVRSRLLQAFAPAVVLLMLAAHPAARGQAPSLTLDQILARYYATRGGLEKWEAVNTIKLAGSIVANGYEATMTIYGKRPDLTRQEITTPQGTMIDAFDGTTAWAVNPIVSATPILISGPQADMIKQQSSFDGPLVKPEARGIKVELVGFQNDDAAPARGGTPAKLYHLTVTLKDGTVEQIYLDAGTCLETKEVADVDMNGTRMTMETRMSDYRTVDGLKFPFELDSYTNGQVATKLTVKSIELNQTLPDSFFKIPTGGK